MSEFGKVAILMGGDSPEREISLKSGISVFKAMQRNNIDAVAIDAVGDFYTRILEEKFSRVFVAMHGSIGESGPIQGFLETVGLPFTGNSLSGCALSMDKYRTKKIWQSIGLPTLPSVLVSEFDDDLIKSFGLPLCVKPCGGGSSIGVVKAKNVAELQAGIESNMQYGKILVEPWTVGDDVSVAILDNKALPVIMIRPSGDFYNYKSKYEEKSDYICPAGFESKETNYIKKLALEAARSLGLETFSRIDFIRDLNGDYWLLEANPIPGLVETCLFPLAANTAGISYDELIIRLLRQTLPVRSTSMA